MSGIISYTQLGGKSGVIGPIPSFLVLATTQNNFTASTTTVLNFTDVIKNTGNHFDDGAKTFKAPCNGQYELNLNVRFNDIAGDAEYYRVEIVTNNRTYRSTITSISDLDGASWSFGAITVLANMSAGHTAIPKMYQNGGNAQTDLTTGQDSTFSGYLVSTA